MVALIGSRRSSSRGGSRWSALTLLVVVAFFLLFNSLSFFLYFSVITHKDTDESGRVDPDDLFPNLKPWPSLPSALPWALPNSSPSRSSCEAYFGNGFSRKIDALAVPGSGWFRCFYSATLRSSVCEGGMVSMDPARIEMSSGGEELEKVIGRTEEEEMPRFHEGAFQIEGARKGKLVDREFLDNYVPRGVVGRHTMRDLFASLHVVPRGQLVCSQWIENPTLFVTRFEYANLFHTVTDWYSAFVSSRVTKLSKRPDLVFVDGHCKAQLEETWEALFSSLRYAKNFSGPVCFRHAIFSPLGYETAMFKGLTEGFICHGVPADAIRGKPDDQSTARISEFGEMIRAAFGLTVDEHLISKGNPDHNVLFIRREDYLAHPRHNGVVQSRLSNEQEIYEYLKSWSATYSRCKINLINGLFAHMPMKDQIQVVLGASVVIGAHGAGLTHLVAATKGTKVLELVSSFYDRPHFRLISEWKGLEYHAIHLLGSYAKPPVVIEELRRIMESLGC